ncbi:imelysin family protein [Loktanella sp. S4079]|uniref:imelysin family protein n=1 Tax=Loktanella sp. S4079 TaxID=579483 RepID=UPI0005FA8870|nr:imelysin family protein [Loktanella sp. S4079]KJZ17882.1 peptidase M75 [Loktanella sp. S4079]
MKRFVISFCISIGLAVPVAAQPLATLTNDAVNNHVIPAYDQLALTSGALAAAAVEDCDPASDALRAAYHSAFDAWVAVSHLRFGPSEVDDRAFALAFWPDSRGVTPRVLMGLIADQDPIGQSAADYAEMSVAARGYYALEFMMFDEAISNSGDTGYRCQLVQTITADIAATTAAINADWNAYAALLLTPTADGVYRTDEEAAQELFKALSTGLEFLSDTRLGRPLGSFDRPRPKRAEVWRSGRSARHVQVALSALHDLAGRLAGEDEQLSDRLDRAFGVAQDRLLELDDPIFAGVSDPTQRFAIEILQQNVNAIRTIVRDELGPKLGVAAGFNALDGD